MDDNSYLKRLIGRQLIIEELEILDADLGNISYLRLKDALEKRISIHKEQPKLIKIAWKSGENIIKEHSYGYEVNPRDALLDFVINYVGTYRAGEILEFSDCNQPEINSTTEKKKHW